MTASVPSMTALATSNTSARVGMGLSTIDCIICVAVITTRSRVRATWMMRFCTAGSSASPISTPRSPRAIITTSEAWMISSRLVMDSARSILATTPPWPPAARSSSRASWMSSAQRGKDTAM